MSTLRTHLRQGRASWRAFRTMCSSRWRLGSQSEEYRRDFRRWKFRKINRIFSARTRDEDYHILSFIPWADEYKICHQRFAKDDVIIDIGAHIGVFSYMAHLLGSRQVHAYEAETENHRLQRHYLSQFSGIHSHYRTVVRSDDPSRQSVTHSGYINDNTGGGNVIMQGRTFEFCDQELRSPPIQPTTPPAKPIALDEILKPFTKIKLLKMDCEGSEFPILLTSQLLHRVERIIGEYHEIEPEIMSHLDPGAVVGERTHYCKEDLDEALSLHGFAVSFQETARCLGIFEATRPTSV